MKTETGAARDIMRADKFYKSKEFKKLNAKDQRAFEEFTLAAASRGTAT